MPSGAPSSAPQMQARPALLRRVRITSRPLPCAPLIASERHAAQKSWSPAARSGANSHSAGLPNGSSASPLPRIRPSELQIMPDIRASASPFLA